MGEIADMMLDGTMCAGCGEWMHGGEAQAWNDNWSPTWLRNSYP